MDNLHERRYHQGVERLRSPQRLALMEVEHVADLVLEGVEVGNMLDVGTGSGIFAEAFARRGLSVAGVDANPAMLEAARGFVPQGDFRLGQAESLPCADASFDLVFLGHVLHEADDPLKALREARRAARRRVAVFEWPNFDEGFGPPMAHRLEPGKVLSLAEQAGFAKVSTPPLAHMALFLLDLSPEA